MTSQDDDFGIDIGDTASDDFGGDDGGDFTDSDDFGDANGFETAAPMPPRKSGGGFLFKFIVLLLLIGGGGFFASNYLGIAIPGLTSAKKSPAIATTMDTTTPDALANNTPPQPMPANDVLADQDTNDQGLDDLLGGDQNNLATNSVPMSDDLAAVGINAPDVSDLLDDNANDVSVDLALDTGDNNILPPPPSTDNAIDASDVLKDDVVTADEGLNDLFDATSEDKSSDDLLAGQPLAEDVTDDLALNSNSPLPDNLSLDQDTNTTPVEMESDDSALDLLGDTDTDVSLSQDTDNQGTELPAIDVTAEIKTIDSGLEKTKTVSVPVDNAKLTEIEKRLSDLEAMITDFQKMVATQDEVAALEKNVQSLKKAVRDQKTYAPATTSKSTTSTKVSKKASTKATTASKPIVKKQSSSAALKTWVLKSAKPGMAWVAPKGSNELKTITVGDTVSGIGRVTSIAKDGAGKWAVKGTRGVINQ